MFLGEGGVAVLLQGGFGVMGRGGNRLVGCCFQWGVFVVDFRVVVFLFSFFFFFWSLLCGTGSLHRINSHDNLDMPLPSFQLLCNRIMGKLSQDNQDILS